MICNGMHNPCMREFINMYNSRCEEAAGPDNTIDGTPISAYLLDYNKLITHTQISETPPQLDYSSAVA